MIDMLRSPGGSPFNCDNKKSELIQSRSDKGKRCSIPASEGQLELHHCQLPNVQCAATHVGADSRGPHSVYIANRTQDGWQPVHRPVLQGISTSVSADASICVTCGHITPPLERLGHQRQLSSARCQFLHAWSSNCRRGHVVREQEILSHC